MNAIKRVILYLRVSTEAQFEDGYSIAEQKERLLAYCKAHGWIVVAIYVDPGHSGSNLKRPGITALMEAVGKKTADAVLVYKLDRLSRSQKDTLYLIEDVFLPNDTDFVSMQENINTATPFGRAMIGILSVFAQLERETLQERTMMGRTGRAKEGKWHGGGCDPIGYDYIDGELVVNKEEAKQVKAVYSMYLQGHTITDISLKMDGYRTKHGDWSNLQTVAAVLDNELYAGTVHFRDARTPESHDAIINPKTAARVRYMRERNKKDNFQPKESEHLLTGLISCKRCGARYFAKRNPNGNVFYCCHSRAKKNKKMIKDPTCRNENWRKKELEEYVEGKVKELIENPNLVNEIIKKCRAAKDSASSNASSNLRGELDDITNEIDRLMDLYKLDHAPVAEIASKIEVLHQKKMALFPQLETTEVENPNRSFHIEGVKLMLRGIIWSDISFERKRHLLRQLIDTIAIDGGSVNIQWSFI